MSAWQWLGIIFAILFAGAGIAIAVQAIATALGNVRANVTFHGTGSSTTSNAAGAIWIEISGDRKP